MCRVHGSSLESEANAAAPLPAIPLSSGPNPSLSLLFKEVVLRINQEGKISAVLGDFPEANKRQLFFVSVKHHFP